MWRSLIILACLLAGPAHAAGGDEDIMFAPKAYFDDGKDAEVVSFSGTLTGDEVANKNNSYAVTCVRSSKECWISSIEQIGPKQIGRPDSPYSMDISHWSESEIVTGYDGGGCAKVTVTITRKSKSVFWVTEPINQSKPYCAKSNTKIYKWTIENPQTAQGANKK